MSRYAEYVDDSPASEYSSEHEASSAAESYRVPPPARVRTSSAYDYDDVTYATAPRTDTYVVEEELRNSRAERPRRRYYERAPYRVKPTEKGRFMEQSVSRVVSSTVREQDLDAEKAILVYYDAVDAIPDGSHALVPLDHLKQRGHRPWMVQVNGSFLTTLIRDITTSTTSANGILLQIQAQYDALDVVDMQGWRGRMMQCLLEVIRQDLGPIVEARRKIADKTLRQIQFTDLWHLFKPGDVVMSENQGREQLYTVYSLNTESSRDRSRTITISHRRSATRARTDPVGYNTDDEDDEPAVEEDDEYPPFILRCYYTVFDGQLVGPACKDVYIPYFAGDKPVFDLPAYPVSLHPDEAVILKRFRDRGMKFITMQGHRHYEGSTVGIDQSRKDRGVGPWNMNEEVDGEVYSDRKTYYRIIAARYRPVMTKPVPDPLARRREPDFWTSDVSLLSDQTALVASSQNHLIDRKRGNDFVNSHASRFRIVSTDKALESPHSQEYLQLLPHQMPAFVFRLRSWRFLDVDLIREIDKSEAAAKSGFDDLVIPETFRDLLISVIESHKSASTFDGIPMQPKMSTQMDIVRGKGRGLIILLHGPPGVGKTSTAETIAAYSRRPLYPLTSGDIGLTPEQIEHNLNYHFGLASQWGCIMLIDEADVFLMKRDWQDINRNALVSVFLRVLEYYSGILFLTTNRTGVIDEAFKSRMHLYLRYPSIDLDSTKKIWGRLLDRIVRDNKESEVKIEFERSALLAYAAEHYKQHEDEQTTWNARQIRNAFQTAIAMAQYDRVRLLADNDMTEEQARLRGGRYMGVELSKEKFEKIAATTKDFDSFMISVRGGTDGLKAREERLRDDNFDPERPVAVKQYSSSSKVASRSRR